MYRQKKKLMRINVMMQNPSTMIQEYKSDKDNHKKIFICFLFFLIKNYIVLYNISLIILNFSCEIKADYVICLW